MIKVVSEIDIGNELRATHKDYIIQWYLQGGKPHTEYMCIIY
jgi:hypothetical protein